MKIGLIQFEPVWENKQESCKKIVKIIDSEFSGHDLLIFPEMTFTGFTMNSDKMAEEIDGYSFRTFIDLSSKLKTNIFAGVIERDKNKIYNSLIHFDKNGIITARYRKIHPFNLAKEGLNYDAGKEIVKTKIDNINIGLSICYDLRFPELYRFYAKEKIDLIVNIANWPVNRINHWKTLLKARAIENQCFMIGVNRTGNDHLYEYDGSSAAFAPDGRELLLADNSENIFTININFDEVEKQRAQLPFLEDIKMI